MADSKIVQDQWKLFVSRMGTTEEKMHPNQQREMKRAFFGAWGQLIMYIKHDLPYVSGAEIEMAISSMVDELAVYWEIERLTCKASKDGSTDN